MKLIRTIAMPTDHDFYGKPVEITRVELWMDPDVMTPEAVKVAKQLQEERLQSHAKAMPHRYWLEKRLEDEAARGFEPITKGK